MNFLSGVHGVVAVVLLCSLLFVEEAGVPLPFAPGELTLLAGGLLIGAGALNPFIFVPLAIVACGGGAMVGFSWAQIVGERGLAGIAARLHQQRVVGRVTARIRSAGPLDVGVSRLIPGLRIYTTLVAGALGVRRRDFVVGMVPATIVWVLIWVVLGAVVGIPLEHFFTKLERVAIQGGILAVIGFGAYLALRRASNTQRESLMHLPGWGRTVLALAVDLGVVVSILTGLLAVVRRFEGPNLISGWADVAVTVAVVAVLYLFVTRRGAGATIGEALLRTVYLPHRGERSMGEIIEAAVGRHPGDPTLQGAADLLHTLGSVPRLAVLRSVLGGATTVGEVAEAAEIPPEEAAYHLAALQHVGVVSQVSQPGGDVYRVPEPFVAWVTELLVAVGHRPGAGDGDGRRPLQVEASAAESPRSRRGS